jgi:response regulator RpfG family c-di-GMP phosphodiesterase
MGAAERQVVASRCLRFKQPTRGATSLPAHVLVLDAAKGIGPWARDALAHAGLACALVKEDVEAQRSVDAQWPALVVVPLDEVLVWAPVLARLGEGPTTVPVLGVASRDASIDVTPALALGVTDLLTYPCTADDLVDRVASSMRGRRPGRGTPDRTEPASPLAQLRSVTEAAEEALLRTETAVARVNRAEEREHLRQARDSLSHSLQVILGTMIGSAEASGPGREGHSRRVGSLARDLTTMLGWPPLRVRGMELAGLFLDIGLLALPADLLAVRGPLGPDAVTLLREHAEISSDIMEPLARVGVPVAAVRAHHERLDGSGYPRGLRGRQVPFGAQVLAVADTWAALTRARPHRPALGDRDALAVLRREATLGRLPGKLVDVLAHLVAGGGAGLDAERGPRGAAPANGDPGGLGGDRPGNGGHEAAGPSAPPWRDQQVASGGSGGLEQRNAGQERRSGDLAVSL